MRPLRPMLVALATAMLFAAVQPASARIKLITLPVRERVEIQLDHAEATLVEEERVVPLVRGLNQVDFSWANTSIDPNTIVFRVVDEDAPDGVEVLSVSYPPGENALVWQVAAREAGPARVRISYLLGRLEKAFSYKAVAARDERALTLSRYVRIQNSANEEFGTSEIWAGYGAHFSKPIGLDETKEVLVDRYDQVRVTKTYTCDPVEHGYLNPAEKKLRVPMHYVLANDVPGGLGRTPLPFGKVRIFQQDSQGTTAFLGEDWGQFTPLDDEMRLFLGAARDLVVTRTIERSDEQRRAGNLRDYDVVVKYEIENFKDEPVRLDVVERPEAVRREVRGHVDRPVEWEIGRKTTLGQTDPEDSHQDRLVFSVALPARGAGGDAEKVVHRLHLRLRNEW
jgi:hypothetical protein